MTPAVGLLIVAVLGAMVIAIAFLVKDGLADNLHRDLVTLELQFPRDLDIGAIEAFLGGITGLLPPWWKRWLVTPTLTFEIVATSDGIRHRLVVARPWLATVESLVRAHLPTTRSAEVPTTRTNVDIAVEYRVTTFKRPLNVSPEVLSRTLLASLTPKREEQVVVTWTLSPHPPVSPTGSTPTFAPWFDGKKPTPTPEETTALRKKQSKPLFLAVGRIGVSAPAVGRQRALLRQVEAAWHGTRAPGVHLERRRLSERYVARRMSRWVVPGAAWPAVLNSDELTGLLGWPLGAGHLYGVHLSGSRQLDIPRAVSTAGTVIGDGWADGRARVAALDLDARYRHLVVLGPTGTGKTTLLANMIAQDMQAGYGVLVVDPKADLVADVLARVPAHRASDVVVFDAADAGRPIGLNPLRLAGTSPELAVEHLVGILRRIFASSWGVRSDDLWRASLRSLIHDPDGTLADVGPLLTDPIFRRRLVAGITDPVLVSFWRSFNAMSDAEAAQVVSPVLNKWRQVLSRPSLRRIFGQAHPRFDLATSLNNGGIVLVPLATGVLGEEAASLFGAVLLGAAWNVIQGRAAIQVARRHPIMIHLDEFARYSAMPVPLDEFLAQARSYRAGITLATQHLDQLPSDLRQSVLANPRSRLAFQLSGADARLLARDFGSGLTPEDLQGLAAHEVVAQLHAEGNTQRAATLTTRPAPPTSSDPAALREMSMQRWGADGEVVDRAILERLDGQRRHDGQGDAPTGRKRRPS